MIAHLLKYALESSNKEVPSNSPQKWELPPRRSVASAWKVLSHNKDRPFPVMPSFCKDAAPASF